LGVKPPIIFQCSRKRERGKRGGGVTHQLCLRGKREGPTNVKLAAPERKQKNALKKKGSLKNF